MFKLGSSVYMSTALSYHYHVIVHRRV